MATKQELEEKRVGVLAYWQNTGTFFIRLVGEPLVKIAFNQWDYVDSLGDGEYFSNAEIGHLAYATENGYWSFS